MEIFLFALSQYMFSKTIISKNGILAINKSDLSARPLTPKPNQIIDLEFVL